MTPNPQHITDHPKTRANGGIIKGGGLKKSPVYEPPDEFAKGMWRRLVGMVKEMERRYGFRFDSES